MAAPRPSLTRGLGVKVRGRDAADVAMMTAFGDYLLMHLKVWTDEMDVSLLESELLDALQDRPVADALVLAQSSGRLHI